jgi:hypothetical protein
MRSDAGRVGDILDAIAKINSRMSDSFAAFEQGGMAPVRAVPHLQVIFKVDRIAVNRPPAWRARGPRRGGG